MNQNEITQVRGIAIEAHNKYVGHEANKQGLVKPKIHHTVN